MVHGRSSLSGQRAALWCLGGPLCLPDGLLCGLWEVLSVHPTRPAAAHGMSFSTHPTRLSVAHGRSSPATQPGSPWSMGGPQPPSQPPPVPCGASRCRDRVILVACGHNHREDTGVTSTPATSSLQQRGGRVHSGPHPRNLLLPGSIPPPPSTLGLVSPGRDRRTWGHPGCSQPRFGALRSRGGSPIRKPGCRDPPPRGREAQEGLKPGWVQDLARARGSGLIWGRGGHGEGMGGDRGGLPSPDSLSSKLFFN